MDRVETSQQLKAIRLEQESEFEVVLGEDNFLAQKVCRVVRGKRVVLTGKFNDKKAVAKIFYGPLSGWRAYKEARHAGWLKAHHIDVPDILDTKPIKALKAHVVIEEYIEVKGDIDEIWRGRDESALKTLLFSIQSLIARQHDINSYHLDPHPHNFLIHNDRIILIDLSAIRRQRIGKLSEKTCLKNLAVLYSQLFVRYQPLVLEAFSHYCGLRQWKYSDHLEKKFLKLFNRARYRRIQNTRERYFRNCTRVVGEKNFHRRFFCLRDHYQHNMKDFLAAPDKWMSEGEMIKAGNSCTLKKLRLDGKEFIVKRYNIKSFRHGLRRLFRKSRAARSWGNAQVFDVLGVHTPAPIAMLENRYGPFSGVSYFISEYVSGQLLKDVFSSELGDEKRFTIASLVILLLKEFRDARMTHGDMKYTNFILNDDLFILDLDSVRFHWYYPRFRRYYKRDIRRFLKNWRDNPLMRKIFLSLISQIKF